MYVCVMGLFPAAGSVGSPYLPTGCMIDHFNNCRCANFHQGEPGFLGPQGEPGLPGLPGTKVGVFYLKVFGCIVGISNQLIHVLVEIQQFIMITSSYNSVEY